jgi:hypothetical protein|tara:strand:- start:46 stop:963 length:918 start_codon:yes stop_codon:yes gene_type:complete
MKKLALINTYCNTWEKLNILHNNILKLKELGIDSLVYSPVPLPKEITELVDYIIITKENPILYFPERAMSSWTIPYNSNTKLSIFSPDYGWASVYQYQKLIEFASTLDYDHYFPFIYDLNFDEEIIKTFNESPPKLFFPSPKAGRSKVGNNFISLSKENAIKLIPLFNKEKYKEVCNNSIAEMYMEYLCNEIQGDISSHLTKDDIHLYYHNWNLLPSSYGLNLYLQNQEQFKFRFSNLPSEGLNFKFTINSQEFEVHLTNDNSIFVPGINLLKNNYVILEYNGHIIDLSKYYQPSYKLHHYIETL